MHQHDTAHRLHPPQIQYLASVGLKQDEVGGDRECDSAASMRLAGAHVLRTASRTAAFASALLPWCVQICNMASISVVLLGLNPETRVAAVVEYLRRRGVPGATRTRTYTPHVRHTHAHVHIHLTLLGCGRRLGPAPCPRPASKAGRCGCRGWDSHVPSHH